MPQPKKHPSARARANRASTAADLSAVDPGEIPPMPDGTEWHPAAVAYWNSAWTSEMSPEWLASDYYNVAICTYLYHDFWSAETARERKDASAELRLQRKSLGLDPMARRSLEWTIETAEAAKERGRARDSRPSAQQPSRATDPRLALVQ